MTLIQKLIEKFKILFKYKKNEVIEQDNLLDNLVTLEEYIEKHENQKFVEV